ncbi:hypothetical protein ACJX0J_025611 [Zea mays]
MDLLLILQQNFRDLNLIQIIFSCFSNGSFIQNIIYHIMCQHIHNLSHNVCSKNQKCSSIFNQIKYSKNHGQATKYQKLIELILIMYTLSGIPLALLLYLYSALQIFVSSYLEVTDKYIESMPSNNSFQRHGTCSTSPNFLAHIIFWPEPSYFFWHAVDSSPDHKHVEMTNYSRFFLKIKN